MLIGGEDAEAENLPEVGIETGSVAIQNGTGKKYLYHESDGWDEILSSGGVQPTGTKSISITENGTITEDVGNYASAEITVAVPDLLPALASGQAGSFRSSAVSSIREYAFAHFNLGSGQEVTVDFPNLTVIGENAFRDSAFGKLTVLHLDNITDGFGSNAFWGCSAVEKTPIVLPSVTTLSYGQFSECEAFSVVDIGEDCTYIGGLVFSNAECDVILRRTAYRVPLGNTNAFNGHSGNIYVPDNLVQTYKNDTNWSTYSSKILPISDSPW